MSNERDFFKRDEEEQKAFLEQTWCNKCQEMDLGMVNPKEYENEQGIVVVEGQCKKCGDTIVTEIADDSTDGEWQE